MEFEDNSLTNHGWIEHDNIDNGIYIYINITDNGIYGYIHIYILYNLSILNPYLCSIMEYITDNPYLGNQRSRHGTTDPGSLLIAGSST